MRVGVFGASGMMGRAVARVASGEGHEAVLLPRAHPPVRGLDVVVDFSRPEGTLHVAARVADAGVPLVSGTTGLDAPALDALDAAARAVPVLWEPNMSVGVFVLCKLVARAAASLEGWDVEIVETHHEHKVDAPSGTALRLADAVDAGRGAPSGRVFGRSGRAPRAAREIGLHAVRGGSVVGDHVVTLFGAGERVELGHRADDRDVFARGAMRAASWLVGKPFGRYGLSDVLGL